MVSRLEGRVTHLEKSLARRKAAKVAIQKVDDGIPASAACGILHPVCLEIQRTGPLMWQAIEEIVSGDCNLDEPTWLMEAIACHFGRKALLQIVPCDTLLRLQRLWASHGFVPDELLEYVNQPHRLEALNRLHSLAGSSVVVEAHDRVYCHWYADHPGDADSARPYIDRLRWIFGKGRESA